MLPAPGTLPLAATSPWWADSTRHRRGVEIRRVYVPYSRCPNLKNPPQHVNASHQLQDDPSGEEPLWGHDRALGSTPPDLLRPRWLRELCCWLGGCGWPFSPPGAVPSLCTSPPGCSPCPSSDGISLQLLGSHELLVTRVCIHRSKRNRVSRVFRKGRLALNWAKNPLPWDMLGFAPFGLSIRGAALPVPASHRWVAAGVDPTGLYVELNAQHSRTKQKKQMTLRTP